MFRKVMGISDELMWRYWELLTDKSLAEISAMKTEEPMQVKMRLARQIVARLPFGGGSRAGADRFRP